MPSPRDHRDISIVVQTPPTSTSHVLVLELAYNGELPTGQIREKSVTDTNHEDVTIRQLQATDANGTVHLDVRLRLKVCVKLAERETATKAVNQWGTPAPPGSTPPVGPGGRASRYAWETPEMTVELHAEASTPVGAATIDLQFAQAGRWYISVRDANNNTVGFGLLQLPMGTGQALAA